MGFLQAAIEAVFDRFGFGVPLVAGLSDLGFLFAKCRFRAAFFRL